MPSGSTPPPCDTGLEIIQFQEYVRYLKSRDLSEDTIRNLVRNGPEQGRNLSKAVSCMGTKAFNNGIEVGARLSSEEIEKVISAEFTVKHTELHSTPPTNSNSAAGIAHPSAGPRGQYSVHTFPPPDRLPNKRRRKEEKEEKEGVVPWRCPYPGCRHSPIRSGHQGHKRNHFQKHMKEMFGVEPEGHPLVCGSCPTQDPSQNRPECFLYEKDFLDHVVDHHDALEWDYSVGITNYLLTQFHQLLGDPPPSIASPISSHASKEDFYQVVKLAKHARNKAMNDKRYRALQGIIDKLYGFRQLTVYPPVTASSFNDPQAGLPSSPSTAFIPVGEGILGRYPTQHGQTPSFPNPPFHTGGHIRGPASPSNLPFRPIGFTQLQSNPLGQQAQSTYSHTEPINQVQPQTDPYSQYPH